MTNNKVLPSKTLERVLGQFSEQQIRLMMRNMGAIQLTEGCSIGCHFCGFEAKKGVTRYIPFNLIEQLVTKYHNELEESQTFLYYASDPFDYDFEGHDYLDIHDLVKKESKYSPFVATSVPRGKEKEIISLLIDGKSKGQFDGQRWNNSSVIDRISVAPINYKRLEIAFNEAIPTLDPSKQMKAKYGLKPNATPWPPYSGQILPGELHKLLASLSNNDLDFCFDPFQVSLVCNKQEEGIAYIAEIPSGRFLISANYPVNFLDVIANCKNDEGGEENYAYMSGVKIPHGKIINEENELYKLGERNKEDLSELGIGCFHGVLMTPRGVVNIQTVKPSRQYPTGQITTPINPQQFEIAICKRGREILSKEYETTNSNANQI